MTPATVERLRTWAGRFVLAAFVLGAAVLAGMQLASPDKRVIQVLAAGLLVLLAFRSKLITAMTMAVLFLPFPKGTSYGNTNVAFLLLIFIVWIFRVTTRREQPVGRTSLDIPILGLIMAYAISFYNVTDPAHLPLAWGQFTRFLTYVFLLYMVINIVKSSEDVRRILVTQCISCLMVCLFALYEQIRPGTAIVPGWIDFSGTFTSMGQGVRVGSTFLDYELFGEYCALNMVLQLFMLQRAGSRSRRWAIVGLMLLTFYCLFSTVTRGAIVTLIAGLVYLAYLSRKRLNFVRLTTAVSLAIGLIFGGDFMVSHFTNSKSVLERLFASKLEGGMPDSRAPAWRAVSEKVLQSPLIGHGPYYSLEKGLGLEWWPHNVYLYYAYIVGFVGLTFFLWILWELWKASRPMADSMGSGSYAEGATVLMRVMLFMFMLDQTKIDYLRNGTYSFFAWFLLGMVFAVRRVAQSEARPLAIVEPQASARPVRQAVRPDAAVRSLPRSTSVRPAVPPR